MIDYNLLRADLENIAKELKAKRNFDLDINLFNNLEENRKTLQMQTESLQAKRNEQSKNIGIRKSKGEDITEILKEVEDLGVQLSQSKLALETVQKQLRKLLLTIPNLPHIDVPIGKDETENKEIYKVGEVRNFDFAIKDHLEIGENLNGINFALGAKLSTSRFAVLQGAVARLHRALAQFMLDLHIEQHGYEELNVPFLVNEQSLIGTGQLPKFSEDLFHIQGADSLSSKLSLISTAEIPVTNIVRDEILEKEQLPLKFVAHSPCFRSEAGSYGRDTRGLIRMHQFEKVELVQITTAEQSENALEELTSHAEKVLQLLELPYRKVLLCSGDMGFSACKTYDLEVWIPSQNCYREISSCSNMSDFQARRMQARLKDKTTNKTVLLHTLNGSGLAVGRTLVAVLENYQNEDGSVTIPKVLRPYLNNLEILSK